MADWMLKVTLTRLHNQSLLVGNCIAICQIMVTHSFHLHGIVCSGIYSWSIFNGTLSILCRHRISCHSIWNHIVSRNKFLTSLLKHSTIILFIWILTLTSSIVILNSCIFKLSNFMKLFKCKQFFFEITLIEIFKIMIAKNTIFF